MTLKIPPDTLYIEITTEKWGDTFKFEVMIPNWRETWHGSGECPDNFIVDIVYYVDEDGEPVTTDLSHEDVISDDDLHQQIWEGVNGS